MSKSYVDGLRGSTPKTIDDRPGVEKVSCSCLRKSESIPAKFSSLSLPQIEHSTILPTSSGHSMLSLRDYRDARGSHPSTDLCSTASKTVPLENDVPRESAFKSGNHRLTVPPIGDYCIRMSNTSSISDRVEAIELNESRTSDALGYLRMYRNNNRVQFNALQFNDREDLQVSEQRESSWRRTSHCSGADRRAVRCSFSAHLRSGACRAHRCWHWHHPIRLHSAEHHVSISKSSTQMSQL